MNLLVKLFAMTLLYEMVEGKVKQHLMKKLFENYNKNIDPGDVEVQFGLNYLCAHLDNSTGKLQSDVWEKFTWTDNRLAWDPEKYHGITLLRIPSELLWLPDIMVFNGQLTNMQRANVNVVLNSNGLIFWIPPTEYSTMCYDKDGLTTWQCSINAGSWSYDGFAMKLTKSELAFDLSRYNTRCEWKVSSVKHVTVEDKYYSCCPEPYPLFEAEFELTRA